VLEPSLIKENQWWKSKDAINQDIKIEEWQKSKVKWDPRIRHKFDYLTDIVYSLRGPRQVGKTTLIKLQIKDFIDNGINPYNVMYYSFDIDTDPKDIIRIITNYLDNTIDLRTKGHRAYLFLDEVSSITNWQKGIKKLADQNVLQNCTVVVTGSHTLDLKYSNERLPGRRGTTEDTYDKIMLPMKYSEYVSIRDSDIRKIIDQYIRPSESRKKIFENLIQSSIHPYLQQITLYSSKLEQYLTDYLLTGGIPRVIDEYLKKGYISESVYTTYFNSIIGDIHHLDIEEKKFKQLIACIIKSIGKPSSWESLKKDTDIGSLHTVSRYIDLLTDMFILTTFYQYNTKTKKPLYEKQKKIYFHDPFFFHTLNSGNSPEKSFQLSQERIQNDETRGVLVEEVIGDHLIRFAFLLSEKKQMFEYTNNLYYWKYGKDREVDYVLSNGKNIEVPIEVKYQNKITNRDIDGILNFERQTGRTNGIVISKDLLERSDTYIIIPASIFMLVM
jgi:uncharacterized protein